jgi:Phage integrase family
MPTNPPKWPAGDRNRVIRDPLDLLRLAPLIGAIVTLIVGDTTHTGELGRRFGSAADAAGLGKITPHQLRHTYATALVNAGVSLQALMAILGHTSAEMSLRYGRLFDQTVRADYERALTLAKQRLGPLPQPATHIPSGDWRELPLIKARLAGGYCLRTAAQGVCPYPKVCEHCPNFRSEPGMLAVLSAQRADARQLAQDAHTRGWNDEADRHLALVERLDAILAQTNAA